MQQAQKITLWSYIFKSKQKTQSSGALREEKLFQYFFLINQEELSSLYIECGTKNVKT